MRKLFALITVMMMLFCTAQATGLANPWTELDSLEALNEALDMNLQLPGVMGITDVSYLLMDDGETKIGEVNFLVNGRAHTLRGCPAYDTDISGVYLEDGKTAFEDLLEEGYAIVLTDSLYLARWMDINGQYVLAVEADEGMDEETFTNVVMEIQDLTNAFQPVVLKDGCYYDVISERAYAQVTGLGDDTYAIEIHWSSSAFEDNVWTMTGIMTEDGLLTYTDCVLTLVVADEDGNITETVADLTPEGFFIPLEDCLLWSGAAEESCQECMFVLAEE